MKKSIITINVTKETWEELNKNKKAGESFDDVINRLAIEMESKNEKGN